MLTIADKDKPKTRRYERKVPDALIYETMDGEPLYYRGYREVMSGKKNIGEIMGSGSLQAVLVAYINRILIKNLDEDSYWIFTNESGVHIDHRNNLAHDVAVYDKKILSPAKITTKYVDVPSRLAVEIDIKADLSNQRHYDYVNLKTQKLLDFGTETVIWIFTETQKVMTAPKNQDWLIVNWDKDIELMDGFPFNIEKYLNKEGVVVTKKTL